MKDAARSILVIGYGNTLRGDDGVGPLVAAAVAAKRLPSVRVMTVTQLTPELAEPLAAASAAVFIDACCGPATPPVTIVPLRPAEMALLPTHAADPGCLLAVARSLFGRAPEAWLVTIAGTDFGLRETLSVESRHRAREAQEHVECLLRQLGACVCARWPQSWP
jgi:hydrogenase maturation protease